MERGVSSSPLRKTRRQYVSSAGNGASDRSPSTSYPGQNVLMTVTVDELASGFVQVKKKFLQTVQLLAKLDFSRGAAASEAEILHNLESVELGSKTLREIGYAVIERDPHRACMNKIFEDMWLLGFTKVVKICINLEQSAYSAETSAALQSWRKFFITNWVGALCKLQDTLQLYREPRSIIQIIPSLENLLPPGYHADTETGRLLYQLPLTHLQRDVALCLARAYSYDDKELEKVWMDRAYLINAGIAGRRYKEAWERLRGIEHPNKKPKEKSAEVRSQITLFGGSAHEKNYANVTDTTLKQEDVTHDIDAAEPDEYDFPMAADSSSSSTAGGISSRASTKSLRHEYGPVTATLKDLAILQSFMSRNSFVEGLLQGAEIQGLTKLPRTKDDT